MHTPLHSPIFKPADGPNQPEAIITPSACRPYIFPKHDTSPSIQNRTNTHFNHTIKAARPTQTAGFQDPEAKLNGVYREAAPRNNRKSVPSNDRSVGQESKAKRYCSVSRGRASSARTCLTGCPAGVIIINTKVASINSPEEEKRNGRARTEVENRERPSLKEQSWAGKLRRGFASGANGKNGRIATRNAQRSGSRQGGESF